MPIDFIFMVLVVLISVPLFWRYFQKKTREILDYEAERRGGEVKSCAGLFPRLEYPYCNFMIAVVFSSGYMTDANTEIGVDLQLITSGSVYISPQMWLRKKRGAPGSDYKQAYNEIFDSKYVVHSTDDKLASAILTNDVQNSLIKLVGYHPMVILREKKLIVKVPFTCKTVDLMNALLDVTQEILDNTVDLTQPKVG